LHVQLKISAGARSNRSQNYGDENVDESADVDPRGDDLHFGFCGGEAELQKDRQELPNE
jgi:hypothetical protein